MVDPAPPPPDDPLIARWLHALATDPLATPTHRRFVRFVARLWRWYAGTDPLWQGVIYLHVRHGEPREINECSQKRTIW